MTSRISHTTFNALNAYEQSVWWADVLGWTEVPEDPNEPDHEECMIIDPNGPEKVLFVTVPDAKQIRNRVHLDLRPTDCTREEEVARLVKAGATQIDDFRRADGTGWITLTDPEGNEFCVLTGEAQLAEINAARGSDQG